MFATLTIRPAAFDDLAVLHPVIERAYRGDTARIGWTHEADLLEGDRTSLAVLREIVANPRSHLLIAWRDGSAIGCVAIWDCGDGLAHLGQLCVEPTLQDGGLGKRLIAAAEALAVDTFEAERIEMTVVERRAELITWYERRGYRQTGERRDFPIALDTPLFMTVLEKCLRTLVDG